MAGFDIKRYLGVSKALDTSNIDWELAKKYPLTPAERKAVNWFALIEAYTVIYLRDLLCTSLIEDAEAAAFLPCWCYEEAYHGRALVKLLEVTQGKNDDPIVELPLKRRNFKENFDAITAFAVGALTKHFVAVHMTWGAINELMANAAYRLLGQRTKNPILTELTHRIMQDERRHFAFYYTQAGRRLDNWKAQKLVRFIMKNVWRPVGNGIAEQEEQDVVATMLFADEEGLAVAREVDLKMQQLPGLQGLTLMEDAAKLAAYRARKRGMTAESLARQGASRIEVVETITKADDLPPVLLPVVEAEIEDAFERVEPTRS